jgi:hypothetical protein
MIADPPHDTFMLEARSSILYRWVDASIVGGLELEDSFFVDEARESLFENPSGCERPDGGPLSLDRDLRGGIERGLGGNEAVVRGELEDEVGKESGVVEGAASCSGVLRCLSASCGGDM